MSPDRIALRGLRVRGHHGVLDHERRDGQDFVVDAVLQLDLRPAGASDDLADTVDYADLADRLATAVGTDPVDLVETLAQRLADVCLSYDGVEQVELTVHKPQAPIGRAFEDVSVTVVRP